MQYTCRCTVLAYDFTGCVILFMCARVHIQSSLHFFPWLATRSYLTSFPLSDSLKEESSESREETMDILLPLSFAWFQVRAFSSSLTLPISCRSPFPSLLYFRLQYSFVERGFDPYALVDDMKSTPRLSPPAHALVPPAPVTVPIEYMGHAFHLQLPAITLSATLAYCARLDAFPLMTTSDLPPTRAQTTPPGHVTLEDVEYYHRIFYTRTVPRGPGSPLSPLRNRHDWDWQRAVALEPTMSRRIRRYTPGVLTGKWRGTLLVRPACFYLTPLESLTSHSSHPPVIFRGFL